MGNDTLYFTYGVMGPTTVTWNGTTYNYALNAQGDVVAIFDQLGSCVVGYSWDTAWGYNPIPEGSMASTLGMLNPLRYRSYVYDTETGYYYLQSRYYDPEIGRFINADGFIATGQGFIGNNMFSYCLNNPIMHADNGGSLCYTCLPDNPYFEMFRTGSRGGGICGGTTLGVCSVINSDQKGIKISGQLQKTTNPGSVADFTERVFALDITVGSFSPQDGLSLVDAGLAVLEGSYDFGNIELGSKIGTVEANATFSMTGFDVGLAASIWEPFATILIGEYNVTFTVSVGTVGTSLGMISDGFEFKAAGWGISVSWERE